MANYSANFNFIRKDGVEYNSIANNALLLYKPVIPRPKRATTTTNILGGGVVAYDFESYEPIEINIPLVFKNFTERNMNEIMDSFYFVFNGVGGILYLSWLHGYYKVIEVLTAELEDIKGVIEGRVILLCEPFRRENMEQVICTRNTTINLPNRAVPVPLNFKIIGSGQVQLSLNDEAVIIKNLTVDNPININTIAPIYIYDSRNKPRGKDVYCNIIKLKMLPGANSIKFLNGNIQQVQIDYQPMYF